MSASTAILTGRHVLLVLKEHQKHEVAKLGHFPNKQASSLIKNSKLMPKRVINSRDGLKATSSSSSNTSINSVSKNINNGMIMRNPTKLHGVSGPGLETKRMSRNTTATSAAAVAVKPLAKRNVVDAPETQNHRQVNFDRSFEDHFDLGVLLGQGISI